MSNNINKLGYSDHPATIRADSPELQFRTRVKENVDILWQRLNDVINDLSKTKSNLSETGFKNIKKSSPLTSGIPAQKPVINNDLDEYRYFAGLVNFEYDYWNIVRSGSLISNVEFKKSGLTVASVNFSYNPEGQLESWIMSGANSGSVFITYNQNGYPVSMQRF